MQQDIPIEQRIFILESKVADLEKQRGMQDDRDLALLARIDGFIDDLRRIERFQLRSFETLMASQKNTESTLAVVVDAIKSHKEVLETLEAGQVQILAILTGNTPRND